MLNRATRLLALALLLPVATACADMGEEEMGEPADTAAATTPTPEPETETFELQGVNDSGISGEIESETRGDSVFLDVAMEGATGSDYPAHVHSGSCDEMQAPVAAQVSLQWGTTGEAATGDDAETNVRVGIATSDLTAAPGDYSLRFHGSGGEVIACADLPDDLTGSTMPSEGTGAGTTEGR